MQIFTTKKTKENIRRSVKLTHPAFAKAQRSKTQRISLENPQALRALRPCVK